MTLIFFLDKVGLYAYDISFTSPDQCQLWYLQNSVTTRKQNLQNVLNSKKYIPCPYSLDQIKLNPLFSFMNNGIWQKNVQCYQVGSKIFLKDNAQHVSIYFFDQFCFNL
jgi:hypothetical protein